MCTSELKSHRAVPDECENEGLHKKNNNRGVYLKYLQTYMRKLQEHDARECHMTEESSLAKHIEEVL